MTLFSCETTEKLIMTKWYELVFNPLDNLAFDDTETQIQHLGLFLHPAPKVMRLHPPARRFFIIFTAKFKF